jgi:hypothetical protein
MKHKHRYFGESVKGYNTLVLNEREARAGAGILLLPAIFSFLNAYLTHNFYFTKVFVTIFMIDFLIRIVFNPKYAPSLILGRIFVQNQKPEYVGAKQKKFAWSIGLFLAIIMFFMVVIFEIMTPVKIIICLLCIVLLFLETAFGICLGCIIYHKIYKQKLQYCPGNTCRMVPKEPIQKVNKLQYFIIFLSIVIMIVMGFYFKDNKHIGISNSSSMKCEVGKCGGNM